MEVAYLKKKLNVDLQPWEHYFFVQFSQQITES